MPRCWLTWSGPTATTIGWWLVTAIWPRHPGAGPSAPVGHLEPPTPAQQPPVGLRAFYPAALEAFGTDLASGDALAVLQLAPTPERGRQLSRAQLAAALGRGGRHRNLHARAAQIQAALRSPS